jgi:hypothetical protein
MTDYNVVSEREAHFYQGFMTGAIVCLALTMWIIYGGN